MAPTAIVVADQRAPAGLAARAVAAAAAPFLYVAKAIGNLRKRPQDTDPVPLWLSTGRIGGVLTPKQVSEIMLSADQGYGYYRLVDLFDEARQKDCHLHAILSTFELSIAGMELQILPASESSADGEMAAFVEGFLHEFGAPLDDDTATDLPGLVQHLAGGYVYSYAVAEILWDRRNGRLVPVSADPVMPRRFTFDPISTDLHFWDSSGSVAFPGINLRKQYPNRYVTFQPRVTGGDRAREGLIRPLLWASLFRNWTTRDWLQLAELAWKPWRIGIYNKVAHASRDDIVALAQALELLTTAGATLLPDTVDLKIEWAKASGGTGATTGQHQALLMYLADEMSKAVLGATLTAQQGRTGAMALGQVHDEVRKDRRNAAARSIAGVLRRDIVAPAVRLNYGAATAIPQIRFVPSDAVDLVQLATAIEKLVGAGLPISVAWVRALYGMPAPRIGDEVLGPPTAVTVPAVEEQRRMRIKLVDRFERDVDAEIEMLAEREATEARRKQRRVVR